MLGGRWPAEGLRSFFLPGEEEGAGRVGVGAGEKASGKDSRKNAGGLVAFAFAPLSEADALSEGGRSGDDERAGFGLKARSVEVLPLGCGVP